MMQKNTWRRNTQMVVIKQVILDLIQDLRRSLLLFVNSMRGRFQIKFGMTPICSNGGFTLIELLVVVLIIGILAAIAMPQYQKAVLKANLHKGIPLVESLYNAQQAYKLAHGDFATDIDELDVTVPLDESCQKTQKAGVSKYECSYGTIMMCDNFSNIQYSPVKGRVAYLHYLTDYEAGDLLRKAGERWCFAKVNDDVAQGVCQSLGGELGNSNTTWTRYKIQ